MDSSSSQLQLKHFIKSCDRLSTRFFSDDIPETLRTTFLSGSYAKKFYEETVGKEGLEQTHKYILKKDTIQKQEKSKKKSSTIKFNINLFMKEVENGNIKYVREVLENNEECINNQDQFGWTPLMSACCIGNPSMVQVLLQWRPDVNVCDKRGKTCRDLAEARNHQTVLRILDQYRHDIHTLSTNNHKETVEMFGKSTQSSDLSTFYCDVCKQKVENTGFKKHLSSTVHNFYMASKHKMPTIYGIPETNIGFQILVKSGWNKEGGLGPSGEGHKFPPKTILKQDRAGLGAKQYKSRVTHTPEEAKKKTKYTKTLKKDLKSEKRREQKQERILRRMLS